MGAFARIMTGLAAEASDNKTISIDATYLKAHRMPYPFFHDRWPSLLLHRGQSASEQPARSRPAIGRSGICPQRSAQEFPSRGAGADLNHTGQAAEPWLCADKRAGRPGRRRPNSILPFTIPPFTVSQNKKGQLLGRRCWD